MRGRVIVHHLHIGMTGGASLKQAMRAYNMKPKRNYFFVEHEHDYRLVDVPCGEYFFFVVRDPIERFYSGFYSRKRCGAPRLNAKHSPEERITFEEFPHANDLAEALSSNDVVVRRKAIYGMMSIGHVRTSVWYWMEDAVVMDRQKSKISRILRQNNLEKDFVFFWSDLGIKEQAVLPRERTHTHANDYTSAPPLSEVAKSNLRYWYYRDCLFMDYAGVKTEATSNEPLVCNNET